eukprot:6211746-Pleurochrysis_carterae.AAC.1
MMREARNRAEGEQKGARKATRMRKVGVSLFTALVPSFGFNPISACARRHSGRMSWRIVVACIYRFPFIVGFELGRIEYGVVGRPGLNTRSRVASWSPSF